jgi:FKBP-type peptidyl-prolyl cis-trans isomerase
MRLSLKSIFTNLAIFLSALFFLQACGNDGRSGPDFSTVPPPYDLATADTSYTKDGGLEIYVIEKGNEIFTVGKRDAIRVKFTGRRIDGKIFRSSYANGSDLPELIGNLRTVVTNAQAPPVEGLRRGLLGMTEGEKRVIIVPPSLGYGDSRSGVNGVNLSGDSLRYDVELVSIQ